MGACSNLLLCPRKNYDMCTVMPIHVAHAYHARLIRQHDMHIALHISVMHAHRACPQKPSWYCTLNLTHICLWHMAPCTHTHVTDAIRRFCKPLKTSRRLRTTPVPSLHVHTCLNGFSECQKCLEGHEQAPWRCRTIHPCSRQIM